MQISEKIRERCFTGLRLLMLSCVLILLAPACTWMNADSTEMFSSDRLVSREDSIARLSSAIIFNVEQCPIHYAAGFYAIEEIVADELSQPFYSEASVDFCFFIILNYACNTRLDTDRLYYLSAYRSLIRTCGLKSRSI